MIPSSMIFAMFSLEINLNSYLKYYSIVLMKIFNSLNLLRFNKNHENLGKQKKNEFMKKIINDK